MNPNTTYWFENVCCKENQIKQVIICEYEEDPTRTNEQKNIIVTLELPNWIQRYIMWNEYKNDDQVDIKILLQPNHTTVLMYTQGEWTKIFRN